MLTGTLLSLSLQTHFIAICKMKNGRSANRGDAPPNRPSDCGDFDEFCDTFALMLWLSRVTFVLTVAYNGQEKI